MSVREWTDFFRDAGISSSEAQTYKAAFAQHNIRSDMLEDLDKEDLRDMGITAIGDIKRILKYSKKEMCDKQRTTKKERTLSNQIEGWIKAEDVKSEQVNNMNNDTATDEDNTDQVTNGGIDDNDQVMARVEADIAAWRHETEVASPIKEGSTQSNRCSKSASEYPNLRNHQPTVHNDSLVKNLVPLHVKENNVTNETPDLSQKCAKNLKKDQDRKYVCEICDRSCKSRGHLIQHVKNDHLQTRPRYTCDACSYGSNNRANVMQHKKVIHYKLRPYKCDQCPFSAARRNKFRDHIKRFHRGLGKALIEVDEGVETDLNVWRDACKFTCRYCPKEMKKRYDMIAHSKKEHGTKGSVKHYIMSEVVYHQCLICKKRLQHERRQLNDHMLKIHAFNLTTYEAKHYFPSLDKTQNHDSMKNVNDMRNLSWRDACIFVCNNCSKEATNRYDMMLHCKIDHGINGTKDHYSMLKKVNLMCLLCKKLVVHETDILKNHMVEIHSINLATYEEKHYFPSQKV